MHARQRWIAAIIAAALVLAMVPAGALAKNKSGGGVRPLGISYAADTYETGAGDDTPAAARNLTASMGDYDAAYIEHHSLDYVDGTVGDVDWIKFSVTTDDVNVDATSYLLKTASPNYNVDTVIEVYGPFASSSFPYTTAADSEAGDPLALASNDDDDWNSDAVDSAFVFRPTEAGTYYVRIRPYAEAGAFYSDAGPYDLQVKRGIFGRVAGATRIETAIEVSKTIFQSAEMGAASLDMCVVVANAFNYPDALGGAGLAGVGSGPLLLTSPTSLSAGVGNEIKRLGANTVYVVGGTSAISSTVFSQLQALDPDLEVIRVAGDGRIETAAEVAYQMETDADWFGVTMPKVAIIAYAFNYPDALAATPLAASQYVPILLTGSSTLAPATDAALDDLGTTDVIIMGSTSVISSGIESYLTSKLGAGHVIRMAGNNRYETAKLFASWVCDLTGPAPIGDYSIGTPATPDLLLSLYPAGFGVASGATYADALPGGIACGLTWHPLLLTSPSTPYGYLMAEYDGSLPPGKTDWVGDYWNSFSDPFEVGLIFGGNAAISHSTGAVLDNNLMLVGAP